MCVARSFKMVLEISNDLSAMQLQASFDPADVPFRSFRGMDQAVREAMLPDTQVKTANLHEELDGDQPMEFHYVSILSEIKRMLGNPAYVGKMYTKFEYEAMR